MNTLEKGIKRYSDQLSPSRIIYISIVLVSDVAPPTTGSSLSNLQWCDKWQALYEISFWNASLISSQLRLERESWNLTNKRKSLALALPMATRA